MITAAQIGKIARPSASAMMTPDGLVSGFGGGFGPGFGADFNAGFSAGGGWTDGRIPAVASLELGGGLAGAGV